MNSAEHRSTLFLTELIIDLCLFVVCAAVCVALLVHARSMSLESTQLTQAVYLAQSAAEQWQANGQLPAGGEDPATGLSTQAQLTDGRLDLEIYDGETLIYTLEGVARFE